MPVVGEGIVPIRPDFSGFSRELDKGMNKSRLGGIASKVSGALGTAFKVGGTAAVAAFGTSVALGLKRLVGIEEAQAKMRGLGHDAETVDQIMANALDSVKGTAFGLADAATVAASTIAAGVKPGKDLERTLKLVGDAATIAGADFGDMGSIFNKVAAGNRVSMQEVNQLSDRGIPIMQWLADQYGVTADEARKMVERGEVDFAEFRDAIETNIAGAALESGNTTQGAFKNMMAAAGRLGAELAGPVFKMAQGFFTGAIGWIDKLTPMVGPLAAEFGEKLGNAIRTVGEWASTAFGVVSDWWAGNGKNVIRTVRDLRDAIMGWIDDVTPAIQSWISNNLDNVRKWWSDHGDTVISAIEGLRDALVEAVDIMVDAVQHIVDEWDKYKIAVVAAAAVIGAAWVAQSVSATINAAKTVAAWITTQIAASTTGALHQRTIAQIVAGWVIGGTQSLIHAGRMAAAWLIAAGPIAWVGAAVVALVALVIANWDKVSGATSRIWGGIVGAIRSAVNTAIDIINGITGGINVVLRFLGISEIGKIAKLMSGSGSTSGSFATQGGMLAFHSGGVVGRDGSRTDGRVGPSEMIAKLLKGEEVLTEDDPRHVKNIGMPNTDWVLPIGGPFDFVGSALKAGKDWVGDRINDLRGLIAKTARPLVNAALSGVDVAMSPFGRFGEMGAGLARKVGNAALDWIAGVDAEAEKEGIGAIGSKPVGSGYRALLDIFRSSGAPGIVTSTLRSGSGGSLHNSGRAADFSVGGHGNRGYGDPGLRAIFNAFLPYAGSLAELILAGAPFNIKNGKQVGGYAWGKPGQPGNHWNHVHAGTFDNGGILDPGWNSVYNATGAPELLTPAGSGVNFNGPVYFDANPIPQLDWYAKTRGAGV